jgi:hypothetical protein
MMPRTLVAIAALAFLSFACSIFVGGPAYPDPPIPVSPQAGESLQTGFERALADAATSGSFTLEITESELTSYLAARLEAQPKPLISEPQVTLRDGLMKVYGKTQTGILLANAGVTVRVSVDATGAPQIEITQTIVGPVPAPAAFDDALSSMLREALTGSFGPAAIGFRLQSITIADGTMTLTGSTK